MVEAAIKLPHAERVAAIIRECQEDQALAAEALAMLRASESAEATAVPPSEPQESAPTISVFRGAAASSHPQPRGDSAPREPRSDGGAAEAAAPKQGGGAGAATDAPSSMPSIGPYQITRRLGEGGFGEVFLAEQSVPIRRRVALKLLKPGMDSQAIVGRFEAERQALAMMDHPHIARVLDAGTTEQGQPYFVMEFVEGVPITTYAEHRSLGIRERLELFQQVCSAIEHAHAKGVIHRDIKPSNVIASTVDDRPFVKVIDFGIAKAVGGALTDRPTMTEEFQVIGTPSYMSPEQARGSLDIDTRTDVYALGILLYELLTGTTPIDRKRLKSAAWMEMLRIIIEEEPPPPSSRISQTTVSGSASSSVPMPVPRLVAAVRGDLDWIVMKAIEKTPQRRYRSAAELAEDIARSLRGDPIMAAPPSAAYRARKFVRRHRWPVAAATAVLASLLLGLVGTSVGFYKFAKQAELERVARRDADAAKVLAEQEAKRATEALAAAEAARAAAVEASDLVVRNDAISRVQTAALSADLLDFATVRAQLDGVPEEMRGWEWRWIDARCNESDLTLIEGVDGLMTNAVTSTAIQLTPEGRRLLICPIGAAPILIDPFSRQVVAKLEQEGDGKAAEARGPGVRLIQGTLMKSPSAVQSAEFSSDGRLVLTGALATGVRIWNADSGAFVRALGGPLFVALSATFSPNGDLVAAVEVDAGGGQSKVKVWPTTGGEHLCEIDCGANISLIAFSPDGGALVTANWDGLVAAWNPSTGEKIAERRGPKAIFNRIEFIEGLNSFVVSALNGTIVGMRGDQAPSVFRLSAQDLVGSVALSPSRDLLVAQTVRGTVVAWNPDTTERLLDLEVTGDALRATALLFSPQGSQLFIGTECGAIEILDMHSGGRIGHLYGHTAPVFALRWMHDGRLLSASRDGSVRLWDLRVLDRVDEFRGTVGFRMPTEGPDGITMIVPLRSAATKVGAIEPPPSSLGSLARSRETTAARAPLTVARIFDGAPVAYLENHGRVTLNARFVDGGALIAGRNGSDQALLWSDSGSLREVLANSAEGVAAVSGSTASSLLLLRSASGEVSVWNATSGSRLHDLRMQDLKWTDANFGEDGSTAVTVTADGVAVVWNAVSATAVATIRPAARIASPRTSLSKSGQHIAVWGPGSSEVLVNDARTGQAIGSIDLGSSNRVTQFLDGLPVIFDEARDRVLVGTSDGSILVWAMESREIVAVLGPDTSEIMSLALSPDGTRLLSVARRGPMRLWCPEHLSHLLAIPIEANMLYNAVFTADGSRIMLKKDLGFLVYDSVPASERLLELALVPAIDAAGGAGLLDDDLAEERE
ncbi:MAG: protein kinase [Phycisphaeraceae bacterium]|nr:protein kinase [Phycisphaeraceae bacterium]